MPRNNKNCPDCGPLPKSHFEKYVESFAEYILPDLGKKWMDLGERVFIWVFICLGLVRKIKIVYNSLQPPHILRGGENNSFEKISLRTGVFVKEGKKRGWDFWVFKGPAGYLNVFEMKAGGKRYFFEGLPYNIILGNNAPSPRFAGEAGHPPLNSRGGAGKFSSVIDDKARVKEILLKNNLPAPEGKSFWFFNRGKAIKYGIKLGFPLVVKPRSGSMSHHVTTNIKGEAELHLAIKRVLRYEPTFIVEKCLSGANVYRATIIGREQVACVQRVPANIVGDGIHSVSQLIEIKNSDPKRGLPRQKNTTLYRLVINETSQRLLKEQGFGLEGVVPAGKIVYLQEKIILDLGADLVEVTNRIHEDNIVLLKKVAEIFNSNLVGIDFLCQDISHSWKEQKSGIIELNSLPYIDMHHFPSSGEPVNVASWLCDLISPYKSTNQYKSTNGI